MTPRPLVLAAIGLIVLATAPAEAGITAVFGGLRTGVVTPAAVCPTDASPPATLAEIGALLDAAPVAFGTERAVAELLDR